jgi:GntR family transcriptional regulator
MAEPIRSETSLAVQNGDELAFGRGTALHRQIFLVLREQILQGAFKVSRMLPTEDALCSRYGVSRITVRRALGDLAAQGLVVRHHGKGTFVNPNLAIASPRNESLIDSLQRVARTTQVTDVSVASLAPPASVGLQLCLPENGLAVSIRRVRSIRGTPVTYTEAWVPQDLAHDISEPILRRKPLYEVLLASGTTFGRAIQEITAVTANSEHAARLCTEMSSALLKLVRLMYDKDGRPVMLLTAYLTPERSRLLMDIPGDSVNSLVAGQFVHDI